MKERKIEIVSPLFGSDKLSRVDRDFIAKDFIDEKDIDKFARIIVGSIQKKLDTSKNIDKETEAVVYILQPSQILNNHIALKNGGFVSRPMGQGVIMLTWMDKNGHQQSDTITQDELEPFLQKIRLAVLNKLSGVLPKNIFARILKRDFDNRTMELEEGRFYKDRVERLDAKLTVRENKNIIQAREYLHKIPPAEQSPYVFFGTETVDPESGATIAKKINLTNVEEVLKKNKPEISKVLGYIVDAIKGHRFLLSHDLILTDNHLGNIGIDKDTDKAILYDLDGLRRKSDPVKYVVATGYLPPERKNDPDTPATESNVVYELGIGLGRVVISYIDQSQYLQPSELEIFLKGIAELRLLMFEMTNQEPEERPTLAQVEERLLVIVQS